MEFKAKLFRKRSGTTQLEQTIEKLFKTMAQGGFAGQILGGFALQQYGYARYTDDVDVVVDRLEDARAYLSIRGFKPVVGNRFDLVDRDNGVVVELLPGGKPLGPKQLPLPMPTVVSDKPVFITLHDLIENKLDAYLGNPIVRAKDLGDVVELLKVNKPSIDLLNSSREDIVDKYQEVWNHLS
jgi:hypothetical protein